MQHELGFPVVECRSDHQRPCGDLSPIEIAQPDLEAAEVFFGGPPGGRAGSGLDNSGKVFLFLESEIESGRSADPAMVAGALSTRHGTVVSVDELRMHAMQSAAVGGQEPSTLGRGFVFIANPADGSDELWAPGLAPRPVRFVVDPDTPRWNFHLPVVYDSADNGGAISLIDWPVTAGEDVPNPGGLERMCPAPSVAEYLAATESWGPLPLEAAPRDPVLLAFTLRMMQLTVFEAQHICRAATPTVTDDLLDRINQIGLGLEHSPDFIDHALGALPYEALGTRRKRLLRGICVGMMLLRRRGLSRATSRASEDDLRTVLAPFVAVCGPVPGVEVKPIALPSISSRVQPTPSPQPLRPRTVFGSVTGTVASIEPGESLHVGGVLAAIGGQTRGENLPTLGQVAMGRQCTHHRIKVVTPDDRPGRFTVLVQPKIPDPGTRTMSLMSVDSCRDYLADNPDAMSRAVAGVSGQSAAKTRKPHWWKRLFGTGTPHGPTESRPTVEGIGTAHHVLWNAAIAEHDRIREGYLAYELDPELILLYPGVTDVTITPTAVFHQAAARADALRTDTGPHDPEHADAYHQAVTEVVQKWIDCEDHARRLGHSHLRLEDAQDMDKAIKLLRHAGATHAEFERAAYLGRAQQLVDELTARNTVRIGAVSRRQLARLEGKNKLSAPPAADT